MRHALIITIVMASALLGGMNGVASAGSPTGWSPVVVPRGEYRQSIRSMPINQRPGRFLHVYGNTVRLVHQRRHGHQTRPMRQIFIGTSSLRSESGAAGR